RCCELPLQDVGIEVVPTAQQQDKELAHFTAQRGLIDGPAVKLGGEAFDQLLVVQTTFVGTDVSSPALQHMQEERWELDLRAEPDILRVLGQRSNARSGVLQQRPVERHRSIGEL